MSTRRNSAGSSTFSCGTPWQTARASGWFPNRTFPEVRELFKDYYILEFKRIHSMAQRTHPGSQFGELLIGNYDLLEREREQPEQMSMTEMLGQPIDNEQILKERIIPCRNRTTKS